LSEVLVAHNIMTSLRDSNFAALNLLRFWDNDAEDAVLHGSFNTVLVDVDREAKGTSKLSDAAFRDPVLRLGLFRLILRLGNFSIVTGILGIIRVLDGSLVTLMLVGFAAFRNCLGRLGRLNEASWRSTRGV